MDTVDAAAAAGAGDGGVARGRVTAQLQTRQNGDALHTQVKVATGFAEGRKEKRRGVSMFFLAAFKSFGIIRYTASFQSWKEVLLSSPFRVSSERGGSFPKVTQQLSERTRTPA